MRMDEFRQHVQPSTTEWAFTGFMRLLALLALAGGVFYWVRLIGLRPGLLWRFDLMPWMWQTAAAALAVLLPVAATGLWMRAPWGAVLWFAAAAAEMAIYSVFSRYFESRPVIVAYYGVCILIYIVFRVLLFFEKRRQARPSVSADQ
ncbi:MAG: hypothetical protein J0H18_15170 [Rhizobiales bacterium]|nr:hypothetical protein [Hyphomicrobiales bacterium]OJX99399.1 MAG: hypothetical protein BGP07_05090 [Rhizobiales bacterium 63-22]